MKTCKRCGKAMDSVFNVCPYCGLPVADTENENEQFAQPQNEQQSQQSQPNQQHGYQNGYTQPNQGAPYNGGYYQQNYYPPNSGYTPAPRPQRSAYIAAMLAIIGGMFGLHNFYLDNSKRATIQLVVSLAGFVLTFGIATIAVEVWAITEALKILKGEINTDGTGAMIKMGW